MAAILVILRTMSSITFLVGLVMAVIGGWYDYKQTLAAPIGPFGLSMFLWGFIIFAIGTIAIIAQLRYEIRKRENLKVKLEVSPNSIVGREITLVVHNNSNISADFSAIMTCTFDYGELMNDVKIHGLMNVSMGWEASGKATEMINGGGRKILKLCSAGERDDNGGTLRHYMQFYKVESDSLESIECADYSAEGRIPKVKVDIQLDSSLPLKGRRVWAYEVRYINNGVMLAISPLERLRRQSFIRKVLRLNKFKKRISE